MRCPICLFKHDPSFEPCVKRTRSESEEDHIYRDWGRQIADKTYNTYKDNAKLQHEKNLKEFWEELGEL